MFPLRILQQPFNQQLHMKETMTVEAQTINVAATTNNFDNDIDIEDIVPKATEVALTVFRSFGSDSFKDYVRSNPRKFLVVKDGLDEYVDTSVINEIDHLSIQEDMKGRLSRIAHFVLSAMCYIAEGCMEDLAEKYRDEVLDEIWAKYEYEDEDIAWDSYLETEDF